MIVLDTNVVSELMRAAPAPPVTAWLGMQPSGLLSTTAVTVAEIGAGLALMPAGARRRDLWTRWERLVDAGFGERIFAFDKAAARVYGELFARRQRAGRPGAAFELQIAAIAAQRGAVVATRNVADFEGCGVPVINPWSVPKPA